MLPNVPYFAVVYYGILRAGGVVVPMNVLLKGREVAFYLSDSGAKIVFAWHDFGEAAQTGAEEAGSEAILVRPGEFEQLVMDAPRAEQDEPRASDDTAVILYTSGTTGTPKGAPRTQPRSLAAVGALLSKVPFRSEEATYVAAPLFHALGFAHAAVAMGLGSTLVIKRRFEPQQTLAAVAERRTTALIVVPVMLQRILALGDDELARHDTSALRIIFVSGSQLEGDLARRAMDRFGDVVYNLYGSTEVAWATIGTPEDLRAAPGCAGRPPFGTRVRLYDADGRPAARGETGRIFVGNVLPFEGYTGGGTKEIIDGLMSTGDVGHFDEAGRLFVDGRDDEMIVSGGENVFPREIEELLATHEDVEEAAALGVPDEQYGQRLRVFLVPRRELSEDDVKSFIRENLARFKVPREVVFVDELPRNPAGKILKRQLAEQQP
jgi:fatty-acyl-CoA synthase